MLFLVKNIIFIFALSLYDFGNADSGNELFSSIYSFVLDVKNNSDGLLDFATKIHAIFCPDQPICKKDGTWQEGKDVFGTLPSSLGVGSGTVKLEDVRQLVGICCLPCSCSDGCHENNNCCPSKLHFDNDTRNNESVKSECILPKPGSYLGTVHGGSGYFMITQCFEDQTNSTLVQVCEHPSAHRLAETGPVTSRKTGRTYWNKNCALCNEDADDIMKWDTNVMFNVQSLIFFGNNSFLYPETFEKLHELMVEYADITYIPPMSLKNAICVRSEGISSCRKTESDDATGDVTSLKQACQHFFNPVVYTNIRGRQEPYKNIFCFFCAITDLRSVGKPDCQFETDGERFVSTKQMTAVLDYESEGSSEHDSATNKGKNKCPCSEVFDSFLGRCRPLFCPVGEFLLGCDCKQPLKNITGMPVLLKLRVVPKTNRASEMTKSQMGKYHTALENMLQNTVKGIAVATAATFKQDTEDGEYYISMVIARSTPGHETLKTIKPFLAYLDSDKELYFKAGKLAFITKVTDRILLWNSYDIKTKSEVVHSKDLDKDGLNVDPIAIYTDTSLVRSNLRHRVYQPLSPLLYCMQVRLTSSEYFEKDYRVTINTTTPAISVPYYYKVAGINQSVRVCVNQYLPKPKSMAARSVYNPTLWLIALSCLAIKRKVNTF